MTKNQETMYNEIVKNGECVIEVEDLLDASLNTKVDNKDVIVVRKNLNDNSFLNSIYKTQIENQLVTKLILLSTSQIEKMKTALKNEEIIVSNGQVLTSRREIDFDKDVLIQFFTNEYETEVNYIQNETNLTKTLIIKGVKK